LSEPGCDLIAENLACRRGERMVFTGVSFRLSVGGALILMGANGSGKTSLLRILATLLPRAAGRLLWRSTPIEADMTGYRTQLRYVGHQDAVKPDLTPRETLTFWTVLHGVGSRRAPRFADAALAAFGLDEVADWPCRWLSAGQRRRLALARLLAAPASIWLLDEPTAALDYNNQQRLESAIATHRANGGRVVVASHQAIDIAGATMIKLDAFIARLGFAAAS
jgi:heme exporter protein A